MFNNKEEEALKRSLQDLTKQTNRLADTVDRIEKSRSWSAYARPWRFMAFSFLNGILIALGSTLGFAVVLYILQLLGYLPIIGQFFSFLTKQAIK